MANPLTADELLAAASDAFRGDQSTARSLLAGVRERARERAREALDRKFGMASAPADGASPSVSARPLPAPRTPTANERAAFAELAHQRSVIERLERANAELAKKVAALEKRSDQALMGLVEGLGQQKRLGGAAGAAEIAGLKRAADLQQLSGVIGSVQSAAYGEKGAVFSKNNLMLAANQIAWMYAAPALQRLGLVGRTQAQLVATLAPLGSLITGGLTLGRQQHVRFVSGVETFDGSRSAMLISLRDRIADGEWDRFASRTDVPVTVTSVDGSSFRVSAVVRNGNLILVVTSERDRGRVAWVVDTGADGG